MILLEQASIYELKLDLDMRSGSSDKQPWREALFGICVQWVEGRSAGHGRGGAVEGWGWRRSWPTGYITGSIWTMERWPSRPRWPNLQVVIYQGKREYG